MKLRLIIFSPYILCTIIFFVLTILVAPTFFAKKISAQSALEVQGLRIDPFLIELNMAAGQVVEHKITLTNTTNSALSFNASINDFVPNGNTGLPMFLDVNQESDPKYSLSRWITITRQPQFTIAAQGKTEVVFKVAVPNDAEPGTHYGGILFGQVAGQLTQSGAAVQHKAGSIILVKLGKSQEQVNINNFFTQKHLYQLEPVECLTTLHNFGNVHSKPKGDVKIRNVFGVQVAEVPVNPDAQIVLPESQRDFISQWKPKLGFGKYTAESILYYGSPKIELRAQTTFWIIPIKELILGVLMAIILGIISYIGIRRYNSYIIKRSRNEN